MDWLVAWMVHGFLVWGFAEMTEAIAKAEADVRGWLKTYRDPDGPERVVVDLSEARWDEAWVFVDRVMDLGKRLNGA